MPAAKTKPQVAKTQSSKIKPGMSTREIRRLFEDDELEQFQIGVANRSPLQAFDILGVTFEKSVGEWMSEERTFKFGEGRQVELPEGLADAILERASYMWVRVNLREDSEGRTIWGRIEKSEDLFRYADDDERARKLRAIERNPVVRIKGRPVAEWVSYDKFIILSRLIGGRTPDLRQLEVDKLNAEIRQLKEELELSQNS